MTQQMDDDIIKQSKIEIEEMMKMMKEKTSSLLTNIRNKVNLKNQNIEDGLKMADSTFEKYLDSKDSQTEQIEGLNNHCCDVINSTCASLKQTGTNFNQSASGMKDDITQSNERSVEIFERMSAACSSCVQKSEDSQKQLDDVEKDLVMKTDDIISHLNHESSNHVKDLTSKLDDVHEKTDLVESSIISASREIIDEVDRLNTRIVRIVPTGETPARKEYKYSRIIPPTPDDGDLIRMFQEQMADAREDTEEELCSEIGDETDSIDTLSMQSGNSDDLNQSITIPNNAGVPFFTNRKSKQQHHGKVHGVKQPRSKVTRLPLRATNNLQQEY